VSYFPVVGQGGEGPPRTPPSEGKPARPEKRTPNFFLSLRLDSEEVSTSKRSRKSAA
jgi:hypothetical protein